MLPRIWACGTSARQVKRSRTARIVISGSAAAACQLNKRLVVVLLAGLLVVGAGTAYVWSAGTPPNTSSTTSQHPGSKAFYMEAAGSLFYAVEATDDVHFQSSGYAYFSNSSITFMGVKFQTICPSSILGCPNPSGNTTQTSASISGALIWFTMKFSDGKSETTTKAIGSPLYVPIISTHVSPKAGIIVEYFPANKSYRAFLLVSPYNLPGSS